MIGTLIALCVAILLQFYSMTPQIDLSFIALMMTILSIPFLVIFPLGIMWTWVPLQKAEQNTTPRILDMFRLDKRIRFIGGFIVIFPLLTILLIANLLYIHTINSSLTLGLWILLLGITLDCLKSYTHRVMQYLNPFSVIKLFTNYAKVSIRNNQEIDLCHWIDALTESSVKGIQRHGSAICNLAVSELQEVAQLFLRASKSIAHPDQDEQTKALGISDKVGYMMFFIYQRLDMIFEKAITNRMETTCNHMITILGKIAVSAAKYDVSMASAPLRFVGKWANRAQEERFQEAPITGTCTLYEVAKTILTEIDIKYYELKSSFLSIINGMEILAKGAFQRNKDIDISLLMQPFRDLKKLFDIPSVKDHQDAPVILHNINRVLGEFDALLLILNTMPKIPEVNETTLSPTSGKKDLHP